ncbi:MAG TPA: hypothetical protein VFF19_24105 [Reyranella sp.]|nr:hypothetical protein [Reyranella sp.]
MQPFDPLTSVAFEQQAHAGAVEERQVAEAEQLAQSDHLFIERLGAVDVGDGERDLTDLAEVEHHAQSYLP